MNSLVPQQTALSIGEAQTTFTDVQLATLKQTGLANVSPADLSMFFHQCKRTGLDPFTRQIYLIPRGRNYSIQTSIDGFRLVATRTGLYVGSEESWQEDANGRVVSATVIVYRLVAGEPRAFSATAHMAEYDQKNQMWRQYPRRLIAKCAEALALRKAFPMEMSGLYTSDEMPTTEPPSNTARQAVQAARPVATAAEEPASGEVEQDLLDELMLLDCETDIEEFKQAAREILARANKATKKEIIAYVHAVDRKSKAAEVQNA